MTRALVVAKAPHVGQVKTRLGADIGMRAAAEVAAAALLDTIAVCAEAFGARQCLLAMAGDLRGAERGAEIGAALAGWHVFPQRGGDLGARLAHAHRDVRRDGPLVQVGMDTPQMTTADLHATADLLGDADAVLAPAEDGGWWALGLHSRSAASVLRAVPMSTATTGADTRAALERDGRTVVEGPVLRDVDTALDADLVAAACGDNEFARAWSAVRR